MFWDLMQIMPGLLIQKRVFVFGKWRIWEWTRGQRQMKFNSIFRFSILSSNFHIFVMFFLQRLNLSVFFCTQRKTYSFSLMHTTTPMDEWRKKKVVCIEREMEEKSANGRVFCVHFNWERKPYQIFAFKTYLSIKSRRSPFRLPFLGRKLLG